jgi:hypothetical protein
MQQEDSLTVLLTGRAENKFADIIKRMVKAKKLEFDMVCLKPHVGPSNQRFSNTMAYKQALLRDILATYKEIEEVKIYEDRPKHVKGFRDFCEIVNHEIIRKEFLVIRKTFEGEVIHVTDSAAPLDPVTEVAAIQRMINSHNAVNIAKPLQIKRTIFFTGYLLNHTDTDNLTTLLDENLLQSSDTKVLANNIMITPRPATAAVLEKAGGLGSKLIWQVTHVGNLNGIVYAARVTPIPNSTPYYIESPTPMVVLATTRGGKAIDSQRITNWQPVATDKQIVFETTVGEKVQLRIEPEVAGESEFDSLFPNTRVQTQNMHGNNKRKVQEENDRVGREDRRTSGQHRGGRGRGDRDRDRDRGHRNRDQHSGRGRNNNRGDGRAGNRNRPRNPYRSLDDVPNGQRHDNYVTAQPNYDDSPMNNSLDGYSSNFPPLGGSGRAGNMYDDDGGLPYH